MRRSHEPAIPCEVLGIVPIEVTDALLDTFSRFAGRPDRGFLVEQVLEMLNS
jgi:hypothetical protein